MGGVHGDLSSIFNYCQFLCKYCPCLSGNKLKTSGVLLSYFLSDLQRSYAGVIDCFPYAKTDLFHYRCCKSWPLIAATFHVTHSPLFTYSVVKQHSFYNLASKDSNFKCFFRAAAICCLYANYFIK